MTRMCRAQGCIDAVQGRYSVYCNKHDKANRRHGDPHQVAVTKAHFRPFVKQVEMLLDRNETAGKLDKVRWEAIESRWAIVVSHARDILADREAGRPGNKHRLEAAQQIVKLDDHVVARDICVAIIAMYLLRRADPRRFVSDRAFSFQLQRRLRGLSEIRSGSYYDHKTGKVRPVFTEAHAKTIAHFAMWVEEALGPVGLHFCLMLDRKDEAEHRAKQDFRAALAGLEVMD